MSAGVLMPLFIAFMPEFYDAFNPEGTVVETYDTCLRLLWVFIYLGLGIWLASYLYLAFFGMVAEYTGMIFRVKYLESVLRQDI